MINAVSRPAGPSADPSARRAAPQELIDAANGFEAIFLRQILASMRQGSLGDDLFGGSETEQFRSMQYDQIADSMAANGSFGIAEMLLARFNAGAGTDAGTGTRP